MTNVNAAHKWLKKQEKWVHWCSIANGIFQLTVFCSGWVGPLGFVWGMMKGKNEGGRKIFEVAHSYTLPFARHMGVRSMMNDCLFKDHEVDVIITAVASEEGGRGFLMASGYTVDRTLGLWRITKQQWTRYRKKQS
jgi:hypothetical protein